MCQTVTECGIFVEGLPPRRASWILTPRCQPLNHTEETCCICFPCGVTLKKKNPDSGSSPMMWVQPTDAHSKTGLCSSACWTTIDNLALYLSKNEHMLVRSTRNTASGTASLQRCKRLLCCPIHPNEQGLSFNAADQTWCSSQPTGSTASWTENSHIPCRLPLVWTFS